MRTNNKLKVLYLHSHNVYEDQIWEDGDLPWGAPTNQTIWCFEYVVLQTNKITSFHHQYHGFYDYQTWHDGHLPWAAQIHKVTEPMVLQDHITNWNHYLSNSAVPVTTKITKFVTWLDGLPSI